MMENQHSLGLVSQRSGSQYDGVQSSFEMSRVEEDGNGRRILDWFQLKSPLPQINRTAQQHFNNRSAQHFSQTSGNNNNQNNTSQSNMSYKQRSLLSPGIQRQFSQIDQFLKQTYQKYGIYELIKQFVEMEDQLVSTFEYLKKLQVIKNNRDQQGVKGHYVKGVSCFEEINEVDEFSFQAEENIIHEFLYNLQQFFVPQLTANINENDNNKTEEKFTKKQQQSSSSGADYSFSAQKPFYQNNSLNNNNNISNNNFINTQKKNGHIHTSRSKHIILNANNNLLKSNNRNVFTDEKMIQSITLNNNNNSNNLNHSIMPLRFDQSIKMSSSLSVMNNNNNCINNNNNNNKLPYHQHQQSIKQTNSEIIGQQQQSSIVSYSENYQQISNQQQLLKTIFQLRQQILTLKQQKYINKNGAYSSGQSSFILDGSLVLGQQQYHFKHLNLGNINHLNSGRQNGNSSYCQYDDGQEQEERMNDSMLLDSSREHLGAMLGNNNNSNNFCCNYNYNNNPDKRPTIIATSLTKPLIISQDISNQQKQSQQQSYSTSTFKLDMLESVQQQQLNNSIDKQNDPNYDNVLLKYFSNQKKLFKDKQRQKNVINNTRSKNSQQLLTEKFGKIVKTQSEFISESLYPIKENSIDSHFVKPKKQQTSRSQTLSNFKSDTGIFIQKFFDDFKLFFKTQMQIQLILLSMIKKKKSIKPSIYGQFNKMIQWYGDVKINRATRLESVEKFTYECLKLKGGILDDLKRYM